ncbi:amidohydrolase (plasmid) [Sphingomonas paeninsulae]|jgi:predicted TIM-barrel fold metal-dependent hydrolase|uniref:Amidohydrolase n=1 Tax=Sphingomonas paeninsulae TaxID=2319844 RepID=A0A494THV3_SPHPE|nr:amidohydrolase family protein [Sphingomonas paeninsulae]AYJ85416.1 amidohydrolase [Sphingomonas paeninsulae]
MQMEDLIMISVDDHAVEPPEAFIRHYPEGKKDRAPKIIDKNGKDVWSWAGRHYPTIGLNAVVGRPRSEYGMEPTRFEQLRPGCFDPKARVDDMNVNGILSSLNFPTMPSFAGGTFLAVPEKDEALLAIRAWNDWHVLEWCGSAPGRFIPMIILPLWDINETLTEMRRMSKLGVHAISFPDNPALVGLPSLHNEYWEPFWKECCALQMVINCHIGTGARAEHASEETPIDAWITTMPMSISNSAADWLFGSFWKRYPDLRMALSEGGIGWIPYFLERADFTYEHHHEWTFSDFGKERPSDVFKRQIVTCFIDDQFGLKNLEYMNPKMVCYEADYPHSDTLWPNCPEFLWASLLGQPQDVIDDITHKNAMRLYNFDPFTALGGRENCTVKALRYLGRDVDISPRENLGGLKTESMNLVGEARRPVTSGEIMRMFASA